MRFLCALIGAALMVTGSVNTCQAQAQHTFGDGPFVPTSTNMTHGLASAVFPVAQEFVSPGPDQADQRLALLNDSDLFDMTTIFPNWVGRSALTVAEIRHAYGNDATGILLQLIRAQMQLEGTATFDGGRLAPILPTPSSPGGGTASPNVPLNQDFFQPIGLTDLGWDFGFNTGYTLNSQIYENRFGIEANRRYAWGYLGQMLVLGYFGFDFFCMQTEANARGQVPVSNNQFSNHDFHTAYGVNSRLGMSFERMWRNAAWYVSIYYILGVMWGDITPYGFQPGDVFFQGPELKDSAGNYGWGFEFGRVKTHPNGRTCRATFFYEDAKTDLWLGVDDNYNMMGFRISTTFGNGVILQRGGLFSRFGSFIF